MTSSHSILQIIAMAIVPILLFGWIGGIGVLAIKRRWGWAAGLFALGLAWPVWMLVTVYHPFGAVDRLRVLDRKEAPGPTELVLTQARNPDWREPYTLMLWMKPPGKPWGGMLIEQASGWWGRGEIRIEGREALVYHGREKVLRLDLERGEYDLIDIEDRQRPVWLDSHWEPREGGEYREAVDRAMRRQ